MLRTSGASPLRTRSPAFDVSDGVALFVTGGHLPCAEGADVNDHGIDDLGDAIYIFASQFSGGVMPPTPFPGCFRHSVLLT